METKPKGYSEGIIAYLRLTDEEREILDDYLKEERAPWVEELERVLKQGHEESKRKSEWFEKHIFPQMTGDEQYELMCNEFCGTQTHNKDGSTTIWMGAAAMERVDNFRKAMIDKYKSTIVNATNQGHK